MEPEGTAAAGDDADEALAYMGRVKYSKVKFANFKLAPVKGWLTAQLKEDIEGMSTTVYEAEGALQRSFWWVGRTPTHGTTSAAFVSKTRAQGVESSPEECTSVGRDTCWRLVQPVLCATFVRAVAHASHRPRYAGLECSCAPWSAAVPRCYRSR